jgi:hypothetical protein
MVGCPIGWIVGMYKEARLVQHAINNTHFFTNAIYNTHFFTNAICNTHFLQML